MKTQANSSKNQDQFKNVSETAPIEADSHEYISEEEAVANLKERIAGLTSLKEIAKVLREVKKTVKPRIPSKPRKSYKRKSMKYTIGSHEVLLTVKSPENQELPEVEMVPDGDYALYFHVQGAPKSIEQEISAGEKDGDPESITVSPSDTPISGHKKSRVCDETLPAIGIYS